MCVCVFNGAYFSLGPESLYPAELEAAEQCSSSSGDIVQDSVVQEEGVSRYQAVSTVVIKIRVYSYLSATLEGSEETTWSLSLHQGCLKGTLHFFNLVHVEQSYYLTPKCDSVNTDAWPIVTHGASLTGTLKYSCSKNTEASFSVVN